MNNKVLVVDDDKDILEALQIILEREKFTVTTVFKGEETYRKVNEFKPNLILLDVLMSGNDGRTICKKIKSDTKTKHIPIILMSAHPSAARDYAQFGGNNFIAKPFEIEDLIKMIKKYIT